MKLLLKNGRIADSDREFHGDVFISGGTIDTIVDSRNAADCTLLRKALEAAADRVIDLDGKILIPGGIDPHTHFDLPLGNGLRSSDDFKTGTIAAAHGGTTMIIDFPTPAKNESLERAFKNWRRKARGAVIDYGFHMALSAWNKDIEKELAALAEMGIGSIKCYMAYKNILQLDDSELLAAFKACRRHGILPAVHAENGEVISCLSSHYLAAGRTAPRFHALSHPASLEAEAITRAAALANKAGSSLYIVHLSSETGLKAALAAKKRFKTGSRGRTLILETCPQYLFLDDSNYRKRGFEGAKFVCSPPLRSRKDTAALVRAVVDGKIDIIATDHCPFFYKTDKKLGIGDFTRIPNGMPGVEHRMILLYSRLVATGKLSLKDFVKLTSTSAARVFNLYPTKGCIRPGADADLVVIDPEKKWRITAASQHQNTDYTPYEGMQVTGRIDTVITGGKILIDAGKGTCARIKGSYRATTI